MIEIIKPEKPAEPQYGDILYGHEYISHIYPEDSDVKGYSLDVINENHWSALEKLDIDILPLRLEVRYECPFDSRHFYWIYPLLISGFTKKDILGFPSHYAYWLENTFKPEVSKIDESFLGHGYTPMTCTDDGSGRVKICRIDLSDGRYLICAYHEWYNK